MKSLLKLVSIFLTVGWILPSLGCSCGGIHPQFKGMVSTKNSSSSSYDQNSQSQTSSQREEISFEAPRNQDNLSLSVDRTEEPTARRRGSSIRVIDVGYQRR